MTELVLATRGSRLALAQAGEVADRLRAAHPGLRVRLSEVSTAGDVDRHSPVVALSEVGAFVRAVQKAVLEGKADAAVHSSKDLPVAGPEQLVSFYPPRSSPWDVICGAPLADLPDGATVGTGSPRRQAQLRLLRPDLRVEGVRGNLDTRLAKVERGELDAVVVAEAGLLRLERPEAIAQRLGSHEMVPAAGQGALAIEAPTSSEAATLLEAIDDPETRLAVEAERALLELTDAGCRSALGAHARVVAGRIEMIGFVSDERGSRRATAEGDDPKQVAAALQTELRL